MESLAVDLTPVKVQVKDGVDVNVYKVFLEVEPAGNQQYSLSFANLPTQPVVKSWGLVVGKFAQS